MDKRCPTCGQEVVDSCFFKGCRLLAQYEGWYATIDPFTQEEIGHLVRIAVCDEHAVHLRGYKKFIETFKEKEIRDPLSE